MTACFYADKLAHALGVGEAYQIVPFRGECYELTPERRHLTNMMVYPTPDPELPSLGVHFTRRTDDRVVVGPNAVLAFGREAYRNTQFDIAELRETASFGGVWKLLASKKMLGVAWDELNKSYCKSQFVAASQRLVPKVRDADFVKSYAGIRAQIVDADGNLIKNPLFEHGKQSTHVLNAVSPGLKSSLPFGEHIAAQVLDRV
jgi:L-2-hydroxyglutarate oxidase LhgO